MLVRSFYIKDIANIAGPIILGNLGFILIGVGDVIVAGRHSTNTLAAVSLATAIINCIMIFGIGILCSISAVLSNYRGAGKEPVRIETSSVSAVQMSCIVKNPRMGSPRRTSHSGIRGMCRRCAAIIEN